jgi:hypothetical protein
MEISLNCTIQNERSVVNEARKTLLLSMFSHRAASALRIQQVMKIQ